MLKFQYCEQNNSYTCTITSKINVTSEGVRLSKNCNLLQHTVANEI